MSASMLLEGSSMYCVATPPMMQTCKLNTEYVNCSASKPASHSCSRHAACGSTVLKHLLLTTGTGTAHSKLIQQVLSLTPLAQHVEQVFDICMLSKARALSGMGSAGFSLNQHAYIKPLFYTLRQNTPVDMVDIKDFLMDVQPFILLCRDTAQAVAKQEIADLRRRNKREGLDLTYLKNVILGGFESGELSTRSSTRSSMLPVLARLLEFSPTEVKRATNPKIRA